MFKHFLLSVAMLAGPALLAQSIPSDKLVAYFPFNKCDATDDSGNNSSGAILNDTTCVCGAYGSALHFDKDTLKNLYDGLLLVGSVSDVFGTSDFTVSFYIQQTWPRNKGGSSQVILSKQESCDAKTGFWVRLSAKANKSTISSGISENGSTVIVQGSIDPDKCWQYVTLVRNNTKYSMYINGQLRDSKNSAGRLNVSSNAPVKVSQPICIFDSGFYGDMDDLRFHNKALSAEDINRYYSPPDMIQNSDTLIYLGNALQIRTSNTCANQVSWLPTTGVSKTDIANPTITPILPTSYTVSFRQAGGCIATDTIHVKVIDPDTLDCNRIFIPNAFTPGASLGRNDRFGISNPFSVDEFISFEVFDRWGGRVFAAESPFDSWDGSSQGQALNAGVFLYRLRYKCDGTEKVKSGTLTLLR